MREYNVGDIVTIRQWDDMMEEFGAEEYDGWLAIKTPVLFISDMRVFCGEKMRIISKLGTEDGHRGVWYYLETDDGDNVSFMFDSDMFESSDYSEEGVFFDEGEFLSLLK